MVIRRPFRRKPNRLPLDVYRENQVCSLSISTNGRRPAFRSASLVNYSLGVLREKAEKRGMRVLAYCFMPDHVHLLIHNTDGSSLIDFVRDFKQMTEYRYKQRVGVRLWQKGYWDHFARCDEGVAAAARYIWHNPVRAGIVGAAGEYAFSGSLEWDRDAVLEG